MQQLPWVLNWMEVQHRSVQPIPQQHRRSKRVNKANSRNVMQSVGRVWRPDRLCQTGMCRCSGFIIHTEALHLGASPDGKVNETNENLHLVMLRWIAPLKNYVSQVMHIKVQDGHVNLKHSLKYYWQVQGQQAITGLGWCDFHTDTKTV